MRIKKEKQIYALYKGDTFIDVGTLDEISERQKIRKAELFKIKSPYYVNRKKRKENTVILVKLDDDEEE